jgi:hypothetical protein
MSHVATSLAISLIFECVLKALVTYLTQDIFSFFKALQLAACFILPPDSTTKHQYYRCQPMDFCDNVEIYSYFIIIIIIIIIY